MKWKPIATVPISKRGLGPGTQILVGFQGQFRWYSYVADANGAQTAEHMQFAPPTHWTEIVPPAENVIASLLV